MPKFKVTADFWDIEKAEYVETGSIVDVTKKRAEEINKNVKKEALVAIEAGEE